MGVSTVLDPDRVWTVADLAELPDEVCRRVEIVDGLLIVSPPPIARHAYVTDKLVAALTNAAPADVHISGSGAGFEFGRSYRVPDVCVLRTSAFRTSRSLLDPADLVLVVEVESPSSLTTDRITKPAQYAAAGIAHFWRVETDPLRLHTYRLVDDVYGLVKTWAADETARIAEPFTIDLAMTALLPD